MKELRAFQEKFFPAHILPLLFFIAGAFFVYRFGVVAVSRVDHLYFMKERIFLASDWDYFWKSLSHPRTNILRPGDFFLFRPGFFGTLALLDIWFRHNLYAIGSFSILLHGLTVFAFYLLTSKLTHRPFAFLLSVALLVQYAGMEMVFWRNVSPYLFGLFFFTLGLNAFLKQESMKTQNHTMVVAGTMFFLSTMFHEMFVWILLAGGLLLNFTLRASPKSVLGTHASQTQGTLTEKTIFLVCLIPAILYFFLNLIDFVYYKPPAFFGSSDTLTYLAPSYLLKNFAFLSGLFSITCFVPGFAHVDFPISLMLKAAWDLSTLPKGLCEGAGILVIALTVFLFGYYLVQFRDRKDARSFVGVMVMVCWGVLTVGLTVGRIGLRSIEYLYVSTYYYYISNFILLAMCALLMGRSWRADWSGGWRERLKLIGAGLVLTVLTMQAIHSYSRIDKILRFRFKFDNSLAQSTLEIAEVLKKNPGTCYGGSFGNGISDRVHDMLLYRFRCTDESKTALYSTVLADGSSWLSKLKARENERVPIDFEKDFNRIPLPPALRSNDATSAGAKESAFFSKEAIEPAGFGVRLHDKRSGEIFLGSRNFNNFISISVRREGLAIQAIKYGVSWTILQNDEALIDQNDCKLVIGRMEGRYLALCNQQLLAPPFDSYFSPLLGELSLVGRVGFYGGPGKDVKQQFSDIFWVPVKPGAENYFIMTPTFRLQTPRLSETEEADNESKDL